MTKTFYVMEKCNKDENLVDVDALMDKNMAQREHRNAIGLEGMPICLNAWLSKKEIANETNNINEKEINDLFKRLSPACLSAVMLDYYSSSSSISHTFEYCVLPPVSSTIFMPSLSSSNGVVLTLIDTISGA